MEGSPLRVALKGLIAQVIQEIDQQTPGSHPEEGTVTALNTDGSVTVQTTSSVYGTVGTPIVLTVGAQVIVLTSDDGRKVAVQR